MFSYCRLCAEQKKTTELKKTIFDWGIKEKLVACCMWKPSNEEYQIPQTVCNDCVDQLENCWKFANRISESEQKLLHLMHFSPNGLEYKELEPDNEFIDVKLNVPEDELEADEVSTSASETESDHSRYSRRGSAHKTQRVKRKKKASKVCSVLKIVSKSECNLDGTITDEGMAKMDLYLAETITRTWNDCEFKCNDCDYSARGFNKFHTHDQTTHSRFPTKRSFPCLYCDQVCKRLQSLVVHISYRHMPHLSFCCTFCSKYYWDLTQLKYHREEHEQQSKSSAPEPKCEKCNKTFRNIGSLRKHVRTVCSPRDATELYECDICKRKYRLKGALKDHMNKHSRQNDYVCDKCGKSFYMRCSLRKHMIKHADVRPFPCEICGKGLQTLARLKSHMKLHEEDKPFICDVCGKRYHDQNAVKLHMVGHLEVLPFPCTYCDKRFRHKGLLNVHTRTHTGYRPYACEHCSYAATSSANLRNHTLRKHGIDMRGRARQTF
ncbi:zinc finger protein 37 homolog [Sitodiplosis mosellana]|uniref:zinc finger protein 37 homolog n=1 Tax=Sitodiplosis mosellana TaxID=263140 RepID=UPI002444E6B7|nr:zinc finger protein 37 homolog [Sitodiplosis mosellana]